MGRAFGIRWVVVVQTSWFNGKGVWNTLGSRCTNVAGSLGRAFGIRWVVVVQTSLVQWEGRLEYVG